MNTNVNTVAQNPTAKKTKSTSTAGGVDSSETIKSFIESQLALVESESISGMRATASTLKEIGFTSSANVRYSAFLEAFTEDLDLRELYAEHYPSCVFLPWKALHNVMQSMDLWLDSPENYTGAVPGSQLPWIEMFEMRECDEPTEMDVQPCLNIPDKVWLDRTTFSIHPKYDAFRRLLASPRQLQPGEFEVEALILERVQAYGGEALRELGKQYRSSLFVVAPPEAFKTEVDWIERCKRVATSFKEVVKIAPDDPLVVKFVRGGCLIVAAWGDEAAMINKAVRDLKL